MTTTHTSRYLLTEAEPQPQHTSELVSIRNLFNDRDLYENYPSFQRGYVWPEKFKRALIDSILRGYPIHPFLTYKDIDPDGKEKYWVIDGQQRLSTIYEYIQGKFPTSTIALSKREAASRLPPIEAGKRFNELSERAKNFFYAYKFVINVMDNPNEESLGLIFRRVQHQLPLTMAEKLASYTSNAITYALQLQKHAIWEDFYIGHDTRKETLQGSLSVIALEMAQDCTSLNSSRLHEMAAGSKDKVITQGLYDAVLERLDVVMHVFAGTTFTHRAELIPMYQTIIFLEKDGYTFTSSDKGCLTSWFGQLLYESNQTGRHGFAYPMAKLVDVNQQRDFWDTQYPQVKENYKHFTEAREQPTE